MAVEKLKPFPQEPVPHRETPQCVAHVQVLGEHERSWRLGKGQTEPFQCSRPSVVKLGDQYLCRLHGGHKALDMLLSGQLKEV